MAEHSACVFVLLIVILYTIAIDAKILNQNDVHKYNSCDDILKSGRYNNSGSYAVFLNTTQQFEVYCRFEGKDAYVPIMQQKYGRVSFDRGWNDYVRGFGRQDLGDFWIGLYTIKSLTDAGHRVLTVTLQDWHNEIRRLQYRYFILDGNYRLYLSQYMSGNILPDDFSHNNGAPFSTYDRSDASNCALHMRGGWWYNSCSFVLPTGHYYQGGPYTPPGKFYDGIFFKDWRGYGYSLKYIKLELSGY